MAVETPPNLQREPYDVSIFFQETTGTDQDITLLQDRIFPVCTPQIAERLQSPLDLRNETLLHDANWAGDWGMWLSTIPEAPRLGKRGPTHSLFSVALEEACNGAGVFMAVRDQRLWVQIG